MRVQCSCDLLSRIRQLLLGDSLLRVTLNVRCCYCSGTWAVGNGEHVQRDCRGHAEGMHRKLRHVVEREKKCCRSALKKPICK